MDMSDGMALTACAGLALSGVVFLVFAYLCLKSPSNPVSKDDYYG